MNIFESLENLNVSEECFDGIMGLVEEYISERNKENKEKKNEWEKDSATDLKIKRTLDPETTRQLELNDHGSVKRMKEKQNVRSMRLFSLILRTFIRKYLGRHQVMKKIMINRLYAHTTGYHIC